MRHAKERGLAWQLSDNKLTELFAGDCHWCGDAPSNMRSRARNFGEFVYNGIDRVNNSVGYVDDNVVSCCFVCNSMKRDFSQDVFIEKALKIAGRFRR